MMMIVTKYWNHTDQELLNKVESGDVDHLTRELAQRLMYYINLNEDSLED